MENDSRVSTSAGVEDGAVVLWPRMIGFPPGQEANDVQLRIKGLVERAMPDAPVDVRPDPERTCPRMGCAGVSVGTLFVAQGDSCLVVAIVSEPGVSPQKLVPWAGRMNLRAAEIPFREPAESWVQVRDFVPCAGLSAALAEHDAEVEAAIQEAAD